LNNANPRQQNITYHQPFPTCRYIHAGALLEFLITVIVIPPQINVFLYNKCAIINVLQHRTPVSNEIPYLRYYRLRLCLSKTKTKYHCRGYGLLSRLRAWRSCNFTKTLSGSVIILCSGNTVSSISKYLRLIAHTFLSQNGTGVMFVLAIKTR